ncbi:MAG: HIT family protein [Candidatus Pacearchaeota archaeon]
MESLREQLLAEIEQAGLPEHQKAMLRQQIASMSDSQLEAFVKERLERGGCFFCAVGAGAVDVVKIYEDEAFIAFLDAYPAMVGHTIIIAREHEERISDEAISKLVEVLKKLINAFYSLGFSGFNLVLSEKPAAGQRFEHFCLHLIPRKEGDGVQFGWSKSQVSREQLEEFQQKIAPIIEGKPAGREEKKEAEERTKADEKIEEILRFIKERIP